MSLGDGRMKDNPARRPCHRLRRSHVTVRARRRGRLAATAGGTCPRSRARGRRRDRQPTALVRPRRLGRRIRARARHGGAERASASVTVLEGAAETLPFSAASFDTAVSVFTFCSVADPVQACAELCRVLVPGGSLLMLEHVHLPRQPGRWLQSMAAPAWAAAAGGCRLDRDTGRSMREAGFVILQQRPHVLDWLVEFVARSPSGLHPARNLVE